MIKLTRRETLAASTIATLAASAPAWAQTVLPPADTKSALWDLTEIYPNDAAWDHARQQLLVQILGLAKFKGRLGESAEVLAQAMLLQSDLARALDRLSTYASLKSDEDVRVSKYQEMSGQASDVGTKFGEAKAWFVPELLSLGRDRVLELIAANATLKSRFEHALADALRRAEHTLSPESEALLAGAITPLSAPGQIVGQLRSSDIPWPTITLSTGQRMRLDSQGYELTRDAPNRADRKLVFDSFWKAYDGFKHSFGVAYAAKLKADTFVARARKYPTSLARALAGNNIPEAVYRTLVEETNKGLTQLHRYFELRRRMLNLPDMAYYDVYPPLVQLETSYTLEQMRAVVLRAVAPLGRDYVTRMAKATAAKWMDPWPRRGKSPGAYMNGGAYDVHPYLLLNLSHNYDGLTTFAHEWGHALHALLSNSAQVYDKANSPIFLAEIASTLNENLLAAHMLANARTKEEKLFYLGQRMELIRGTFFRQTMFAEFELLTHDLAETGQGLSGEKFTKIYYDLLQRYHGPNVKIDPLYGNEWAYVPHFYANFYVYQYATCISAASYFSQSILNGGARERDNYLSVLKAGGSDYPAEILRRAGLDMAGPAPYQAIIADFKSVLDQAEVLLSQTHRSRVSQLADEVYLEVNVIVKS
jgi:oligoendopeptidase F